MCLVLRLRNGSRAVVEDLLTPLNINITLDRPRNTRMFSPRESHCRRLLHSAEHQHRYQLALLLLMMRKRHFWELACLAGDACPSVSG